MAPTPQPAVAPPLIPRTRGQASFAATLTLSTLLGSLVVALNFAVVSGTAPAAEIAGPLLSGPSEARAVTVFTQVTR